MSTHEVSPCTNLPISDDSETISSEISPQLTAIEIAENYQINEFLVQEYPTYGVDRLLLENRDYFRNDRDHPSNRPTIPLGLRELYKVRSHDVVIERNKKMGHGSGVVEGLTMHWYADEEPIDLIFDIWKQNYFDPRTYPATSDQEVTAFEMLRERTTDEKIETITTDSVTNLDPGRTAKILLWDTHLMEGFWRSGAETIIVPPNVTLDGQKGGCTIMNLYKKDLIRLTSVALGDLVSTGAIQNKDELVRRSAGHLLG